MLFAWIFRWSQTTSTDSVILIIRPLGFLDEQRPHPLTLKPSQSMETVVSVTKTYTPYKFSGHCVDQTMLFFYQYIQFQIDATLSSCLLLVLIDGHRPHVLILKIPHISEIDFSLKNLYQRI